MSLPKLNPVEPPWYGPVCPVVGEGWHREVSPYPNHRREAVIEQIQTLIGAPPNSTPSTSPLVRVGFGSRATVVASLMVRPVCPQLRKCRVRPDSYAWCQKRLFTPLEFINARVAVRIVISGGRIVNPGAVGIAEGAVKRRRRAYLLEAGGFVETTVYDRDRLGAGIKLAGPQP
jgi:hypothetical protein